MTNNADKFHDHVARCGTCSDLTQPCCEMGLELLLTAADYPTQTRVAQQMDAYNKGDVEAATWLEENLLKSV